METTPLVLLWQIESPDFQTLRLTSSPSQNLAPVPFPTRGVWIGGNGWYCVSVNTTGEERASGFVPSMRLEVELTEFIKEQQRQKEIFRMGTKVTRYITDVKSLDTINWPDNTNPFSSPPKRTNHKIDKWVVTKNPSEGPDSLSMEIGDQSAFWQDFIRPDIPTRCYHLYRGLDCGYRGNKYYDKFDKPVTQRSNDECGLSIKSCELRFPTGNLPYGGSPRENLNPETNTL